MASQNKNNDLVKYIKNENVVQLNSETIERGRIESITDLTSRDNQHTNIIPVKNELIFIEPKHVSHAIIKKPTEEKPKKIDFFHIIVSMFKKNKKQQSAESE
jgi:hypothetical protein